MKCYYDESQEAVGTCKSCGKGLSREFATDLGKGLACKNRCEDDVRGVIEIIDRSVSMGKVTDNLVTSSGRTSYASSMFLVAAGAVFLTFGFTYDQDLFMMLLGGAFLIYGAFTFSRARSITRSLSTGQNKTRHGTA